MGDYMDTIQRKVILEAADKGPCVIIGRCADYILRERTDCLNIFVCGNEKEKTKRIMELYNLSETEAKKLMKETNKKRRVHYEYYTEQRWGESCNYSICLNSSDIGYEKCIEIVCDLAKN